MVEIADIMEAKTLRAWLKQEDLPHEAMVALAHRAAMRALPITWWYFACNEHGKRSQLDALPMMRYAMLSGVASFGIDAHIKAIAPSAGNAFREYNGGSTIDNPACAACASTGAIASDEFEASIMTAVVRAADALRGAYNYHLFIEMNTKYDVRLDAGFWSLLREDCADIDDIPRVLSRPLWADNPPLIEQLWLQIVETRTGKDPSTDKADPFNRRAPHPRRFWIDWYQRALDGTETRWPLLRQIALLDLDETGDSYWDNPEKLAAKIAELEAAYANGSDNDTGVSDEVLAEVIEATPNAERLVYDMDAEVIRAFPDSDLPADYLRDTLDRLQDAAETFGDLDAIGNQYSALSPDIRRLLSAVARYADRPLRLHDVAAELIVRLEIRAANGECPEPGKDALIASYRNALGGAITDLQAYDARVLDTVRARALHTLDQISDEDRDTLAAGVADAGRVTDEILRDELAADIATLRDPFATPEATRQALWRITSRLPRILWVWRAEVAVAVAVEESITMAVLWIIRFILGGGA